MGNRNEVDDHQRNGTPSSALGRDESLLELNSVGLQTEPEHWAEDVWQEIGRFLSMYQFGLDELLTKINILRADLNQRNEYNPIEHVNSRIKSAQSIGKKAARGNYPLTLENIRQNIRDIAGIRITCSFLSDVYKVADLIVKQRDVTLLQVKDYVAAPKQNGYRSLHLIVTVPVFLSDSVTDVPVELQIRTVAMDFWASLEHKIYYKFDAEVPSALLQELTDTASIANSLDERMERLLGEVRSEGVERDPNAAEVIDNLRRRLPHPEVQQLVTGQTEGDTGRSVATPSGATDDKGAVETPGHPAEADSPNGNIRTPFTADGDVDA